MAASADTEKDHHDFVYQGKQKPKSMAEIRRHSSCEPGNGAAPETSDVQNVCICTKSAVSDALSSQRLTAFIKRSQGNVGYRRAALTCRGQ